MLIYLIYAAINYTADFCKGHAENVNVGLATVAHV